MTADEIRAVVQRIIDEESVRRGKAVDGVFLKAVATILTSFVIEEDDRIELRADFIHLRKWRKSVEQAQSLTFKLVFIAIITGILGAIWMGFKSSFGK